ncbi:hypothetical protein MTBBW1_1310070 [Desulfamplus magnetovallimortis]|uniref:Uncharacterized protein n=1 Tax=Desulfamplus magnetovallimortis TaxID=1246637 RepID=A0A1W1H7C0_9BACT|nr:hypothetical protein MTBBW1_1310070 [Desulfamplus magnetovallimortis]
MKIFPLFADCILIVIFKSIKRKIKGACNTNHFPNERSVYYFGYYIL